MLQMKWLKGTDDLTDAFSIRMKVFVQEQNVPEEEEIDDIDKIADHIVIYQDDKPAATGRVFSVDGQYFVGRCAVMKDLRAQHLGAKLVNALAGKAFELGAEEVHLHAQSYAQGFYEKLGFAAYGDKYMEAGIEHISMAKKK